MYSVSITSISYLARKDVAKSREGVVKCFVGNGFVQVLDEHVAHSRLPEGGVSLRPHYSDWLPFHHIKVHGVQGSLRCRGTGGGGRQGLGLKGGPQGCFSYNREQKAKVISLSLQSC